MSCWAIWGTRVSTFNPHIAWLFPSQNVHMDQSKGMWFMNICWAATVLTRWKCECILYIFQALYVNMPPPEFIPPNHELKIAISTYSGYPLLSSLTIWLIKEKKEKHCFNLYSQIQWGWTFSKQCSLWVVFSGLRLLVGSLWPWLPFHKVQQYNKTRGP